MYSVYSGYSITKIILDDKNARPAELGTDPILHGVNTPDIHLSNGAFYKDGK